MKVIPILIIGCVLGVSVMGAWYLKRSKTSATLSDPQRQSRPQTKSNAPTKSNTPKPGAEPAHTRGAADAPIMIEEFADFECGGCAAVHPIMKQMEKEFGSKVVVVFREFPLSVHKNGMTAAQAAEAAGLQGKFWEMHDLLFENQKTWHAATDVLPLYREYANQIGLSVEKFERDMASDVVKNRIVADRDRAAWIGVNSTPTAFLNGREIPFATLTSAETLRDFIRAELSSVETRKN
jgi:protein-disulfide isomerase